MDKRSCVSLKKGEKVAFSIIKGKALGYGIVVSVGHNKVMVNMIKEIEVAFEDVIGVLDFSGNYQEIEA